MSWAEAFTSLNASGVTGAAEGDLMDLRRMLDQHAMHVFVSASGSPNYTIQLQGEWRTGHGFAVLAEFDQTEVPPNTPVVITVAKMPARSIRAVCIVTSGTVSPIVSVSSKE